MKSATVLVACLGLLACGGRVVFDGETEDGGAGGGPSDCPQAGFVTFAADVETSPTGIAADAAGVAWTSDSEVWIAGPDGEFPKVATGELSEPWAIVQDGDELYVAGNSSTLSRIVRSSGELVWQLPDAAYDVALDEDHVYFTSNLGVYRVARDGGVVTELEASPGSSLTLDDERVVVLERDESGVNLRTLLKSGGASTALASVSSVADCSSCAAESGFLDRVTVAGGYVFFAVDTRLYRVFAEGGEVELVQDGAPSALLAVVSTGNAVYAGWAPSAGDGRILRVDPSSLESVEIARGSAVRPWSLAPSPQGIYWSTYEVSGIVGRTCEL